MIIVVVVVVGVVVEKNIGSTNSNNSSSTTANNNISNNLAALSPHLVRNQTKLQCIFNLFIQFEIENTAYNSKPEIMIWQKC